MRKAMLTVTLLLVFAGPVLASAFNPCEVLDNPRLWPVMTSALETSLTAACGRPSIWAPAYTGAWQSDEIEPFEIPNNPDIPVSNPADDTAAQPTQSECSVTVRRDDGVMVGVWNDSSHYDYTQGTGSFAGFGNSTDGGLTWTDRGAFLTPAFGYPMGDPDVNLDSAGRFWYSTMIQTFAGGLGVVISRSENGDAFSQALLAHAGPSDDKVLTAIDATGGEFDGHVYMCFMDFNTGGAPVCVRSVGGQQFGSPVNVCPGCPGNYQYQAPFPTVGPDGVLYVAFVGMAGNNQIFVAASNDGGATFHKLPNPMEPFDASSNPQATAQCGRTALKGGIRYMDFPQILLGEDGVIHLAYTQHGAGQDNADAMYVKSADGGQTWSPPKKLNDDQTINDNFMQTLMLTPTGMLGAYWYDRREAAQNLNYKIYLSRSLDNGDIWLPNIAVSDTASSSWSGNDTATCYMGDYNKGSADQDFFYVIWSDNRGTIGGHPNPDVYFDAVPVCDNADARIVWDPPGGTFDVSETPLSVALSIEGDDPNCVDAGVIHYTMDNTEASLDSPVYTEPLSISENTTINALLVTCCGQIRDSYTEEYFFEGGVDDDTGPSDDDVTDDDTTPSDDDNGGDDDSGCGC